MVPCLNKNYKTHKSKDSFWLDKYTTSTFWNGSKMFLTQKPTHGYSQLEPQDDLTR